ncbi:MAG TPA: hypothetical protein VHM66_12750 [Solirubrobacterales bacterium]|nr:hypothetical protein [Solirubrobacterales bacterium]
MGPPMKNSTWNITTYSDGKAVGAAQGLSHDEAIAAIRQAMYGHDLLTDNEVSASRLAWTDGVERYASAQSRSLPIAA